MPGERTAKRLNDKSHLFLSSRKSSRTSAGTGVEAALWLVIADRTCNRAFIAAGVADAVSVLGVHCTLVELGRGLPNAGYYFALEPREYLAPTLDESRVVTGGINGRIRFVYAAGPDRLEQYGAERPPPDRPHVIILAFRHPGADAHETLFSAASSVTERFSSRESAGGGVSPDGIVLFTGSSMEEREGTVIVALRGAHPGAAFFTVRPDSRERTAGDAEEVLGYPRRLLREWGKRSPPIDPFFSDLATNCLQVFSHRRKKGAKNAAG
jgi:hypothetical protein